MLEAGEIDLAVGKAPLDEEFVVRPLTSDSWVLIVPADSALASSPEGAGPEDLADLTLIVPPDSGGFAEVSGQLRACGFPIESAQRWTVGRTTQAFVGAGLGVAIAPRLSIDETDPTTACIELRAPLPPRVIGVYWLQARRCVELLNRFAENIAEPGTVGGLVSIAGVGA
jgi:DNA-binding transcriptional LysR family regulator